MFLRNLRWYARPFRSKDSFSGRLTFENKEQDFPQRVIYERKGTGLLLAAIEGTHKGKEGARNIKREECIVVLKMNKRGFQLVFSKVPSKTPCQ